MDRLSFLKTMALAAACPLAKWLPDGFQGPTTVPTTELLPKVQFRGTPEGQILASSNAGKDWELHTNLGQDYCVHGFTYKNGRVLAQVSHDGRSFPLRLNARGKHWLTTAG